MKFTKMQGIGNDYVYVNCLEEQLENPSEMAKLVSDRHFGIGSDGLILIRPSDAADFEMEMYNADGSRGEMCGNGIRCVAKYVYDYGLTDKTSISVETLGGIKYLELTVEDAAGTPLARGALAGAWQGQGSALAARLRRLPGGGWRLTAPCDAAWEAWQATALFSVFGLERWLE